MEPQRRTTRSSLVGAAGQNHGFWQPDPSAGSLGGLGQSGQNSRNGGSLDMRSSSSGTYLGNKSTAFAVWGGGAILLVLLVIRGLRAPADALPGAILIMLAILVPGFAILIAILAVRRRRTKRLVEVMGAHLDTGMVAFLWPPAHKALDGLGWRPVAGLLFSVPVVGISLDESGLSVWEYSSSRPSMTLPLSDVVTVRDGSMFEGLLNRGAIIIEIRSPGRNVKLALNPRTSSHRELSIEQRAQIVQRLRTVMELRSAG